MTSELLTLVKEAYAEAHDHNKNGHRTCYTYNEAIQYDPLVRALHEALKILESKN